MRLSAVPELTVMLSRLRRIARRWRVALIVRFSGYWDPKWYLAHNRDVAESAQKPLTHYVRYGAAEHRSPGPKFDAFGYWLLNPSSDAHPLLHFLRRPRSDRRLSAPLELIESNHVVLSSGWFDAEWYRSHRSAIIAPGMHPYVDYVHYGEDLGIAPSPLLDIAPLRDALDPAHRTPCLLAGLITQGIIAEQRPQIDVVEASPRGSVVTPRAGRPVDGRGSLIVVVHAYYADVLSDVLSYVAHVPVGTTVVIVVPDADRVDDACRIASDILGLHIGFEVVVEENRGRNFGSLVSDLVPMIRNYDYVLHLHTKKSVYTGTEKDGWRHHLLSTLAGSRALVDTVLGVLDDDPTVGVIYPSTYADLPHWAHHWLGNVAVGRELYKRLGLDPSLVSGIVDYPVGGMFLARTTALDRLWDAGFRIEEFPEEPIGNDGTLAHAIERSILDIARAEGFDVIEIDHAQRIWRRNWSGRRPLPGRSDLERQIAHDLQHADLVSVDLFDTLVLRPSLSPATLQRLAALRVADRFGIDADDLLQRRLAAETRARNVVTGDVRIEDILSAASDDDQDCVSALLNAEVELEANICIPRQWLINVLRAHRRPGQRFVLMSDTYVPRSCIEDLVKKIDCDDLFEDLFVSNEIRARKDSGAMWDVVEERYQISRHRWLHLGDNEHSDVQVPHDRGITVCHIPAPHGEANYRGWDRRQVNPCDQLGTDLVLGLAATALYGEGHRWWDGASPGRRFGWAGIGPMLWTYLRWLIQHPATCASDRIAFLARDGYLSHVLLNRLRPLLSETVPPSSYLLISRCCALSMAQASEPRFDLLLGLNTWNGPVRELVRHRLGIDLPHDPVLDRKVELPAQFDLATSILEPYVDLLIEQGCRDLHAFEHYLNDLGLQPGDKVVLSDLGYSGTIQRCLESVLPYSFTGLYAATTPVAGEVVGDTHGVFGEGVIWPDVENPVMEHGLVLEAIWSADHGQVIRFEMTPDGPAAQLRQPDVMDKSDRRELGEIQEGAIDFCLEVVERFGPEILRQSVDPQLAMKPFAELASQRVDWARNVLANLKVEGGFIGIDSLHVRRDLR